VSSVYDTTFPVQERVNLDMSKVDVESLHEYLWSDEKEHRRFLEIFAGNNRELGDDIKGLPYTLAICVFANMNNIFTYHGQVIGTAGAAAVDQQVGGELSGHCFGICYQVGAFLLLCGSINSLTFCFIDLLKVFYFPLPLCFFEEHQHKESLLNPFSYFLLH